MDESLISGKILVDIVDCLFLNNNASEGASLYFRILSLAQVSVKSSHFEANKALAGSGLFRENADNFKGALQQTYHLELQTVIEKCRFNGNINTAVIVKSPVKQGILMISKSFFDNNWCSRYQYKSISAEDIHTDVNLVLEHIKVQKEKRHMNVMSISSLSDTKVNNVTLIIHGESVHRQIPVALFSDYITSALPFQLHYQCPDFYTPKISSPVLTKPGALMVTFTCEDCIEGYYIGESELVIKAGKKKATKRKGVTHDDLDYIYDNRDCYSSGIGHKDFCHSPIVGKCNECPHGGNCSLGVVALPNYWGYMTADEGLVFHRCPMGYCCNHASCKHCSTTHFGVAWCKLFL